MAEAAPPPLHRGLPDEIAIWEILVRLPPKPLLRCRAVCRIWRCATSSRYFLLAHHARQPSLPLLYSYNYKGSGGFESLDIIPFDADHLQSVARIGDPSARPYISCDGFLVLLIGQEYLCIVNPATRQFARLPSLISISTHQPAGMYPHGPTGDYRILLAAYDPDDSYQVYTLGSSEPPRHLDIEGPYLEGLSPTTPLLFRGGLHWCTGSMIHVFDTTTESFRQMLAPDVPHSAKRYVTDILYGAVLFEMDGMLSMPILNDQFTSIGIWAMQDYENEVWILKYRVELPLADLTVQFGKSKPLVHGVAFWDGNLIILVQFGKWLLQLDMDGKLVANLRNCRGPFSTRHQLKQTLVQHAFFPTLEGYVVNASPFI